MEYPYFCIMNAQRGTCEIHPLTTNTPPAPKPTDAPRPAATMSKAERALALAEAEHTLNRMAREIEGRKAAARMGPWCRPIHEELRDDE